MSVSMRVGCVISIVRIVSIQHSQRERQYLAQIVYGLDNLKFVLTYWNFETQALEMANCQFRESDLRTFPCE
jgi:hypothetical protein